MRRKLAFVIIFALGITVGLLAKKVSTDPSTYRGKSKQDAAKALLEVARQKAEDGSWENIAVGRAYYLGGMKADGQAIFDKVTSSKKVQGGDWIRIGRVYLEAGEWDKAQAAFDKVLKTDPSDGPWLAEIGAYYNLHGDRAKAEEYFDRAYAADPGEVWQSVNAAGSYLGVKPMQ